MGLQVVDYQPGLLPPLTGLINDHIGAVPPGWTLGEPQVASVLESESPWAVHYPDDPGPSVTQVTCVLDDGRLIAAAQWGCYRETCALLWVVAVPGRADGLATLLDVLVARSRSLRCSRLTAGRFAFGVGWLGFPTVWRHLIVGFERAGFAVVGKWLIMTRSASLPEHRLPPHLDQFVWRWHIDQAAAEWTLRAYADQMVVGECEAWGIPRQFAGCPGVEDWITVEWIGVDSLYRRRGVARFLLREQLRHQVARGIRKVILWTETSNGAARALLESLGFQYGPECWCWERSTE